MILNIISLLILIACVVPIFMMVTRHFGVLASIDVDALPGEREGAVKNKIIHARLKRKFESFVQILSILSGPTHALLQQFREPFARFYAWLLSVREMHRKQSIVGGAAVTFENASEKDKVAILLEKAHRSQTEERLEEAENAYVDIIALNKKQVEAYEGLADLYRVEREWEKAEAVLVCACKLLKERGNAECNESYENEQLHYAEILLDLAEVYKKMELHSRAWECIKEAVELQSNNPKYLDALVDIHILLGQRLKAEKALEKLVASNPENQKVDEFNERIKELSY